MTDWRDEAFCVVDVETTGLDPKTDELLSFAAVPIDAGRILIGRSLYRLVRPRRMPDERTVVVHGIRPADVERAPPVQDVIGELAKAIGDRAVVTHVAWVERAFLAPVVRLPKKLVDTDALGRLWMAERGLRPGPGPVALDDLARRLGLPVHRRHHALGDALTTAQVFLALATHLGEREVQTASSLARAERRLRRARFDWSPRP